MIDTITSKLEHAVKLVGTGKVAEPETLSYAINSFCPIGADGVQSCIQ